MIVVANIRYSYSPSGNNIGTSSWVQLKPVDGAGNSLSGGYGSGNASVGANQMPADVSEFDVFDSSGSTMEFGVGQTSGAVDRITVIPPGGPAYPIHNGISRGSLIWLRAIDTAATGGEFVAIFKHGRR